MILGEKIEKAIKEAGLADEVVAGYVDISVATLRRLFKKDSADTTTLIKISEIVKKPLSYFLDLLAEEERTIYNTQQTGTANAGRDIRIKKLTHPSGEATNNGNSAIDVNSLIMDLELCKKDREYLQKEIILKDRIINMLEENKGQKTG